MPRKKIVMDDAALDPIVQVAYAAYREAALMSFEDHPAADRGDVREWEFLGHRDRALWIALAKDALDGKRIGEKLARTFQIVVVAMAKEEAE